MIVDIIREPNFRDTLVAMRLPMNGESNIEYYDESNLIWYEDLSLLTKLVKAGPDHSKSIRGTWVTFDITAPRYWWSEMDTYTIGKQPLSSSSTMHKITSRDLVKEDFENKHVLPSTLRVLNKLRNLLGSTNTEKLIEMKKILPESFLQRRIIQINYQSLKNIYKQRKKHRLPEWKQFCDVVKTLPYAEQFLTIK